MYTIRKTLLRHARLKIRAAAGSSLPRRRLLATEAPAASATIFGSSEPAGSSLPAIAAAAADAHAPYASTSKLPTDDIFSSTTSTTSSSAKRNFVPTPLHPSFRDSPLTQHNVYPASATLEQLALLEVCLATGDLSRARRIFERLRSLYKQEARSNDPEDDDFDPVSGRWQRRLTLPDLLPPHIHTQYLRSMLRQAIVVDQAKAERGGRYKKRVLVSEAWTWFEMLLDDESLYGRLEDATWAIMFKGIVATKLARPTEANTDSLAKNLKPISYLYELARANGRSLETILKDPIFNHGGLAGLGSHSNLEVCQELLNVLAEKGLAESLAEVDAVRQRLSETLRDTSVDIKATADQKLAKSRASLHGKMQTSVNTGEALSPARRSTGESIPFRLSSLLGNLNAITDQRELTQDPFIRQDLLEESAYDAARWQAMHDTEQLDKIGLGTDVRLKSNLLQEYMSRWLVALTTRLEEDMQQTRDDVPLQHGRSTGDDEVIILLKLMPLEKLAFITIAETLRTIGNSTGIADGVKAARAVIALGKAIEAEYGAEAWKALYPDLYDEAMMARDSLVKTQRIRGFMQEQGIAAGAAKEARQQGYGDEADDLLLIEDAVERRAKVEARKRALPWTQRMRARVGGYLLKALVDVATVRRTKSGNAEDSSSFVEEQPAFWQSYQYLRSQKVGVIKLNPAVAERLDKDSIGAAAFPRYLPMLVPPKPWTDWSSGGYRIHPTPIMRTREGPEQEQYVRLAAENGQMTQVFAALDALGSTAWRINRPVYDTIIKVWNTGQPLGEIPMDNAESKLPDPEKPEDSEDSPADPSVRQAYRVRLAQVRIERAKAHSQRCNLNYKLEIAKAYLGEKFYFPHNIDFRGRAYPIPPNLSHIGDDISRGLLEFDEGKPVGKRGLEWLHVQIANTAGFDKASLADRIQFTQKHLDDVMDSADRPLEGKAWWLEADDPWQCLAACMDLTRALRSPNPEEYVSHLPVQQDGTCNGLQHYAALGGDKTGAEQVNLAVGEKPADVYTAVANVVKADMARDLAAGETLLARKIAEAKAAGSAEAGTTSDADYSAIQFDRNEQEIKRRMEVARVLTGKVTRKVVKQTVMTTVYGVTFVGAKRQIQRQLKDRGDIPAEWQYYAASYLADKVLASIGDIFKGASSIQLWLSICARLIGRSILPKPGLSLDKQFKKPMASVIWTTPLGLPVAQPYRKIKKSQIVTALQSVFISDPNTPTAIDPRAQATAFPPNYIHSLDATHMMMTAIECKRRGLVYASVHDSYWTHACDVDEMAAALRDCFIKLHSQDLLGDLKRGFQERYEGYIVRKSAVKQSHGSFTGIDRSPSAPSVKALGAEGGVLETVSGQTSSEGSSPNERAVSSVLEEMDAHLLNGNGNEDTPDAHTLDIKELVKEYGTSALPPLALASDEKILAAMKEREARSSSLSGVAKTDEQLEAEEERLFNMEESKREDEEGTDLEPVSSSSFAATQLTSLATATAAATATPAGVAESGKRPRKKRASKEEVAAAKAEREREVMEAAKQGIPVRTYRALKTKALKVAQGNVNTIEDITQADEAESAAAAAGGDEGDGDKQGGRASYQVYKLSDVFPHIPPRGDFDLEIIRDSPYFFS